MGPTLSSLLTASLLVAQTPAPQVQQSLGNPMTPVVSTPQPGCACSSGKGTTMPSAGYQTPTSKSSQTLWGRLFGAKSKNDQTFQDSVEPQIITQEGIEENTSAKNSFLSRLTGRFSKTSRQTQPSSSVTMPADASFPTTAPSIQVYSTAGNGYIQRGQQQKAVTGQSVVAAQAAAPAGKDIAVTSHQGQVMAVSNRPNVINPRFVNKVGHEDDYSWITGQLEIVSNNRYVIHFAPPEVVDRYQGSLPLSANIDTNRFRNGDLISVRGNLLPQNGRTIYHAVTVDLIER